MTAEEKSFQNQVGNKLTAAREAAGLTQEELAEKIGMQGNSVHRYEAAERKISLITAAKAANVLNLQVQDLLPDEYIHKEVKTDIEREAEKAFHQLSLLEQQILLRQMKALLAGTT